MGRSSFFLSSRSPRRSCIQVGLAYVNFRVLVFLSVQQESSSELYSVGLAYVNFRGSVFDTEYNTVKLS
jgi:hypothetical protein